MADPKRAAKSGTLSQKEVLVLTSNLMALFACKTQKWLPMVIFFHIIMLIGGNALRESISVLLIYLTAFGIKIPMW